MKNEDDPCTSISMIDILGKQKQIIHTIYSMKESTYNIDGYRNIFICNASAYIHMF